MKTWKLTVTEDELKAMINFHMCNHDDSFTIERSGRIHDLTKRLNKNEPEVSNYPKPEAAPEVDTAGW